MHKKREACTHNFGKGTLDAGRTSSASSRSSSASAALAAASRARSSAGSGAAAALASRRFSSRRSRSRCRACSLRARRAPGERPKLSATAAQPGAHLRKRPAACVRSSCCSRGRCRACSLLARLQGDHAGGVALAESSLSTAESAICLFDHPRLSLVHMHTSALGERRHARTATTRAVCVHALAKRLHRHAMIIQAPRSHTGSRRTAAQAHGPQTCSKAPALAQQRGGLGARAVLGHVQRRAAVGVGPERVRVVLREHRQAVQAAVARCVVQRAAALGVQRVHRRAALQQRLGRAGAVCARARAAG